MSLKKFPVKYHEQPQICIFKNQEKKENQYGPQSPKK